MPTFSLWTIFGGDLGARQTLQAMRNLANAALRDAVVVEQARRIVEDAGVLGRNEEAKYYAIRDWLAEHVQFLPDPIGVELLATPRYMIDYIRRLHFVSGDCDDAAILGAALGKAVGLRAKFRALSFGAPTEPFSHVYTLLRIQGQWANLDTTRNANVSPPPAARVIEIGV